MKEDIRIDPKIEDQGLMFRFATPSRNIDVSKDSNSYRFIHCMIDKMMRGYDDQNPEKIGFIGCRNIIEYSLISMLDSYEKYVAAGALLAAEFGFLNTWLYKNLYIVNYLFKKSVNYFQTKKPHYIVLVRL